MTLDLFTQEPKSSAIFSDCGLYRVELEREWDADLPKVGFILLNPSKAGHTNNDPTSTRTINFAKSWGFGGLILGNLFGLCSTDPTALYSHPDPIGPENDAHLLAIANRVDLIVCGWGVHGAFMDRGRAVATLLEGNNLAALSVTKDGHPGHPLYIAGNVQPKAYRMAPSKMLP